jgi:NADPH:quinone reductase-like Zn-dependent oxidoreductase
MQACVYERYGSADVVRLDEVATPAVGPQQVLVRVCASAVTTADYRFRASIFPRPFWLVGRWMTGLWRPRNPILGMDFSGVIEAVGSAVTQFRVGDAVFGSTDAMSRGAHAQYIAIDESGAFIRKPQSLSHQQAAAIPFGANTALSFLRDVARLQQGQRVLILGASGAVGTWAIQLARHAGADVTGVCSTGNLELVRSLGAQNVLDYTRDELFPDGQRYDLIFDTAGVTSYTACRAALSERGTFLPLEGSIREMCQALVTWLRGGQRVKFAISKNTRPALERVVQLIEAGALRPVVDRVYPMREIAEAHRHVESRHKRGSVVIAVPALAE